MHHFGSSIPTMDPSVVTRRFDLSLTPNSKGYAEFSYKKLVAAPLSGIGTVDTSNTSDSMSWMKDIGAGYDVKDPFIDNEEPYDEYKAAPHIAEGFFVHQEKVKGNDNGVQSQVHKLKKPVRSSSYDIDDSSSAEDGTQPFPTSDGYATEKKGVKKLKLCPFTDFESLMSLDIPKDVLDMLAKVEDAFKSSSDKKKGNLTRSHPTILPQLVELDSKIGELKKNKREAIYRCLSYVSNYSVATLKRNVHKFKAEKNVEVKIGSVDSACDDAIAPSI